MSSFPYRDPVIFDWHAPSELVYVWEEYPPQLSPELLAERPVSTGKTLYLPSQRPFTVPAPRPSATFPYSSAQFSPPINFTYDNGAEAPLGDAMVLETPVRHELPAASPSSPPPLPFASPAPAVPQPAPSPSPLVEMTDAAPLPPLVLPVKDEGHFRSKRPVPPTAEDHPTSAIGDDDLDYMDDEPSSFSKPSPPRLRSRSGKSRPRRFSEAESDEFVASTEHDDEDEELSGPTNDSSVSRVAKPNALSPQEQEECDQVHLGASKSPIMQALIYCALRGWGIRLIKNEGDDIRFTVDDFAKYYRCSAYICAKQNPTDDQSSRIKALKRWFPDFPTKREHEALFDTSFEIHVQRGKDNKPKKIQAIIEEIKDRIEADRSKSRKRTR